jgi:hypothetical protein
MPESKGHPAQLRLHGLGEAHGFCSYADRIATPGDGMIIFVGMQNHTAESLKSLEGYHCAWVEQAEMLSQASFDILRPTIRAPNSELWFSWNPRRRADPVDAFFRQGAMPANAVCVMANWRDNQWFNKTMDAERLECLNNQPEQYDHIWEGDYQKIVPNCGSQVTMKLERLPDILGLQAGSLEDPSIYRPAMDAFTASAQPWDHMDPAVQKHTHGLPTR